MADDNDPRLTIPLPGGEVARVPLDVLKKYVEEDAKSTHFGDDSDDGASGARTRSMSVDESGTSDYHIEWELGPCSVQDASGFPSEMYGWHRHPFGNEYAEMYE